MYNALLEAVFWFCPARHRFVKWLLRRTAIAPARRLRHRNPLHAAVQIPWDQRLPDPDAGPVTPSPAAAEVSPTIPDHFDATGIALQIRWAIPMRISSPPPACAAKALGGCAISLDGVEIDLGIAFVYKAHMLEDVPARSWCVGYTNAP